MSSGCEYTTPTGPGYAGIYPVGQHVAEVNVLSDKVRPGTDLVAISTTVEGVAAIRVGRPGVVTPGPEEAVVHRSEVTAKGFFTISVEGVEHLGLETGDDVRLYERGDEQWLVVPATRDPFVGDKELVTDGGLPESLEDFTDEADDRDELPCRDCGDLVERDFLEDRRCVGCRLRRQRGSQPVATDGGNDA